MITHGKDGLLYRFEEFEMMALFIKQVFTDNELAQQLSENAIKTAEKRHNRSENLTKLISIYSNILNG
jgi:glycosyltransferase involved in cell wall biosynthesis